MIEVPIELENNRPFVRAELAWPSGSREVRLHIDTGGGGLFAIREEILTDFGVETEPVDTEEGPAKTAAPPVVRINGAELDVGSTRAIGIPRFQFPDSFGDGQIGPTMLSRYDLVLDYPRKLVQFHEVGTGPHRGQAVTATNKPGGFRPRIEIEIDGERLGMLLDTGAPCSMISGALIDEHPYWETEGPAGPALMGLPNEANFRMITVPVRWGSLDFQGVNMVERPAGTFEMWMSEMMAAPIVGALGGNVLRELRVEIAYSADLVFVERD